MTTSEQAQPTLLGVRASRRFLLALRVRHANVLDTNLVCEVVCRVFQRLESGVLQGEPSMHDVEMMQAPTGLTSLPTSSNTLGAKVVTNSPHAWIARNESGCTRVGLPNVAENDEHALAFPRSKTSTIASEPSPSCSVMVELVASI